MSSASRVAHKWLDLIGMLLSCAPCVIIQVDNAHLSVATLTDEPISKMNSIDSAPKILAVVVGKGDAYAAADGFSDGKAVMPQVRACHVQGVHVQGTYVQGSHARRVLCSSHADGGLPVVLQSSLHICDLIHS